jgi:hypothetical protein
MARPKKITTPMPTDNALDNQRLEEAEQATQQIATLQQNYDGERDLVNQLLGQAQLAGAFAQFSRTISASKLAIVKENKLYQGLSGMRSPNGSVLKGTWAEFCGLLGMSDDKADLDIANLKAFGEEALEAMSRVGIGYRDLRKFRKLPEDQRTALIEAAKEGDKATLLDLAEDLIAKHTKEKESIVAERDAAQSAYSAREEFIGELQQQNMKLREQITREKPTPELLAKEALEDLGKEAVRCIAQISAGLRAAMGAALGSIDEHGADRYVVDQACSSALENVAAALRSLAADFDITPPETDAEATLDPSMAHTLREFSTARNSNGKRAD